MKLKQEIREAFLFALLLLLISGALTQAGIYYGRAAVPEGAGYAPAKAISPEELFRFDSEYYLAVARDGYSYNGDPNSSPNIVFAPMFPLLVRAIGGGVWWGEFLNNVLFLFALAFLFLTIKPKYGRSHAFFILLALATAAGAYSFHAFYSESTMLFFLSLCLLSYQRGWWALLALSSAGLGASRLTAFPMVAVFALGFLLRGWRERRAPRRLMKVGIGAAICVAGAAAYLIFIALEYGNPLALIPEIQATSWGLFHQPVTLLRLVTGDYLLTYWESALSREFFYADIKTINLIWTSLAALSFVYLLSKFRNHLWTYVFGGYFLFIYATNSGSEYLISAHRFFVLMLPIYLMFSELHVLLVRKTSRWLARSVSGVLLLINAAYGIILCGHFNQGVWYYF